jgi:diguanylate cyclase (GGDEF)-like protein
MHFETKATLVAICSIVMLLGLQLLVFWLRDRRALGLGWLSLAFLSGGASALAYMMPPDGNEFLMLGGGNALRILAAACLWSGAREFAGRKVEMPTVVFAVAAWLALCSFPPFLASMQLRMIGTSICIAVFCGLGTFELWRIRDEGLPSLRPATLTFASFAILTLLRLPLVNVAPFPVGTLPVSGPWLAGFSFLIFAHGTFIATLFLALTRERQELRQRRFALLDPLTGLLNRRAFLDEADRMRRRRKSGKELVSVLVLDLDDFKSINDCYGHEAGDKVLQHFAGIARACTRGTDRLYRMGGEEFCFVLPATGLEDGRRIAERIRQHLAGGPIARNGETIRATVSIGVATTEQGAFDLELLLAAGDAAVYEAKARGRNQTVAADRHRVSVADAVVGAAA